MALPDYVESVQGTAVIWGEAGAAGVTNTLSFDGLANGSGIMGASVDLGANYSSEYLVIIKVETGTAPTLGNTVDLYMPCSYDNSVWGGGVTGSAGVYVLGTSGINLRNLGSPVSRIVATADANTVLTQNPVVWRPTGRYVAPVVHNQLGQAIRDEASATDNDSRVILVPRRTAIND